MILLFVMFNITKLSLFTLNVFCFLSFVFNNRFAFLISINIANPLPPHPPPSVRTLENECAFFLDDN